MAFKIRGVDGGVAVASVKMGGNRELRERLIDVARTMRAESIKAMRKEGAYQLNLARERTPFATGALAASGTMSEPEARGKDLAVAIGFGEPGHKTGAYAIAQHQRKSEPSRGDKQWLALTVRREAGRMLKRIAADLGVK
mgnify:CR=1 FL=1